MIKKILAQLGTHPVQITNLVSDNGHKMVSVETTDGSRPWYHYSMGGGSYDDYAIVDFKRLTNVRIEMTNQAIERADRLIADLRAMVEADPFEPVDPPAPEPEYDEHWEWFQECESLRRGNA